MPFYFPLKPGEIYKQACWCYLSKRSIGFMLHILKIFGKFPNFWKYCRVQVPSYRFLSMVFYYVLSIQKEIKLYYYLLSRLGLAGALANFLFCSQEDFMSLITSD